jgi:hypothetical protein
MTSLNPPNAQSPGDEAVRDVGNLMIYQQLHRRLWLEALNVAMDLGLEPPAVPPPADAPHWHGWYDDVLTSLRTITPRIADPLASQWTRGVARVVKYLQRVDVDGAQFVDLELEEIAGAIGERHESIDSARAAADAAVDRGRLDDRDYLTLVWNRVLRDDELMSSASGALHDRTWPPLR